MAHVIREVYPLPGFGLRVGFAEGVTKLYDASQLVGELPAFGRFREHPEEFDEVAVDVGGHGIVWSDKVDLSCDELWEHGVTEVTAFDGLIALSDATVLWRLSESALRKAIAYGKLERGADVAKFGKQWVVSAAAMQREYGPSKAA